MEDSRNIKGYLITKGDKFEVKVLVINDGENFKFYELIHPIDTPEEVVAKFLDDAEDVASKQHNKIDEWLDNGNVS